VPEGRAGRCVGAGVSRGAKSHTAQIDKHQSDVCTLLHASLSLSYVSISTPCDFLYYLQFRTYFSEALLPARDSCATLDSAGRRGAAGRPRRRAPAGVALGVETTNAVGTKLDERVRCQQ